MAENNRSFTELVGTEVSSAEEGRATVSLQAEERHLNPSGTVHGGVIATLVDVVMAEALNTVTEEDEQPFTIQITVNYMKPGKPGTLSSTAQVRKGASRSPSSRRRSFRRTTRRPWRWPPAPTLPLVRGLPKHVRACFRRLTSETLRRTEHLCLS
jgi:uncharacterized protein (TIGR00369 family)